MNPFHLATCALCAKVDIPEVQAVIRLLDPFVQRELRAMAQAVYRELLEKLDAFSDDLGAADVDVLVQAGRDRDAVLEAILAGLLTAFEQGYGAFVSGEFRRRVEDGIDELFFFGAREVGFPFEGPRAELLRQAAVSQLDLMLRETVTNRADELRVLLESFLTTAGPRAEAEATLSMAAGDTMSDRFAFQAALAGMLTPEAPATSALDAWAYLWSNVAAVEAASAGGVRAFEVIAVGGKLGDGRTTQFCRWAHGRIIPLSRIQPQIAAIMQGSLEGKSARVKAVWPFLNPEIARNGNELQFAMFFRRAGLPPYHFGCRSRARPIRIER